MKGSLLHARVVVRTSNMQISCHPLVDYIKKIASKSVPHMQHNDFFSFNQSTYSFVALSLPLISSFLNSLLSGL